MKISEKDYPVCTVVFLKVCSITLVLLTLCFPSSAQINVPLSENLKPFLIAFRIFGWFEVTVIEGNRPVHVKLKSGDENVRSMKDYYGAQIEIAELRSSSSESFIEIPPDSTLMHSSNRKFHFICFVDSTEFLLLNSKIFNFHFNSLLIIIPFNNTEVSTDKIFSQWLKVFSTFPLNIDSEIYFSVQHNSSDILTIYECYKICENCMSILKRLCDFNTSSSAEIKTDCFMDKYQRRRDLNGTVFNVIGVDVQPFYVSLSLGANKTPQIYGGMLAELFLSLAVDLNFTYSLHILNGYQYGSFLNGTWNGMIGSLYRDENDMTVSEVSIASDRLEYIDFTMSFDNVGRKIYIRKTRQEKKINWHFFSNPFTPYLHASIAVCAVALTGFFWAFVKIKENRNEMSFAEASWLILSCLCQKGYHCIPKGHSVKMLFIITYFTSLILFSCYSATLTSQLSVVPAVKLPFNDLAGLVKAKGWLGGPIKGDLSHIYMEKTCPEILRNSTGNSNIQCQLLTQMWVKVVHRDVLNLPSSYEEGLKKVLKGRFAFISTSTGTRYRINNLLNERDSCYIHEMDGDYVLSNLAFGLRKRNPYKFLINYKLLKLWQSGTIQRLKKIWVPQRKICGSSSVFVDISLYDIAVAPLVLLMGLTFSSLMFVLEWFSSLCQYQRSGYQLKV